MIKFRYTFNFLLLETPVSDGLFLSDNKRKYRNHEASWSKESVASSSRETICKLA